MVTGTLPNDYIEAGTYTSIKMTAQSKTRTIACKRFIV